MQGEDLLKVVDEKGDGDEDTREGQEPFYTQKGPG